MNISTFVIAAILAVFGFGAGFGHVQRHDVLGGTPANSPVTHSVVATPAPVPFDVVGGTPAN